MWRFLRGLVGHGSPTVIAELHEPLRRHEITQIRPRSARRTCRRAPSSAARRTTTTASADAVERAPHPCATWTDRRDGLRTRGDRPTRPAPPAALPLPAAVSEAVLVVARTPFPAPKIAA